MELRLGVVKLLLGLDPTTLRDDFTRTMRS